MLTIKMPKQSTEENSDKRFSVKNCATELRLPPKLIIIFCQPMTAQCCLHKISEKTFAVGLETNIFVYKYNQTLSYL